MKTLLAKSGCVQFLLKDLMLREYYQAPCGTVMNRFTCFQTKDYLFVAFLVVFGLGFFCVVFLFF